MRFHADLHIHSKYSRATSRDLDLEHLSAWACRKGLAVVGTGDFTHPAWRAELKQKLVPAEPGLFRLLPEIEREVERSLPPACQAQTRFMLTVEISTICKKAERTRRCITACSRRTSRPPIASPPRSPASATSPPTDGRFSGSTPATCSRSRCSPIPARI